MATRIERAPPASAPALSLRLRPGPATIQGVALISAASRLLEYHAELSALRCRNLARPKPTAADQIARTTPLPIEGGQPRSPCLAGIAPVKSYLARSRLRTPGPNTQLRTGCSSRTSMTLGATAARPETHYASAPMPAALLVQCVHPFGSHLVLYQRRLTKPNASELREHPNARQEPLHETALPVRELQAAHCQHGHSE